MLSPRRTAPTPRFPRLRDRYALGDAAPGVSPICLGAVGDPRVIPAAFDAGVNFFFVSADMHWPLYENVRRGLELLFARGGGVRDDVVVGAVSYVTQPEFCFAPFEEVVDAVSGLGRVDLTIAGGAYAHEILVRLAEYRRHRHGALASVSATGASFHDREACRAVVGHGLLDIGYVRYNPAHRGAEQDLFPHLAHGVGGERARTLLYNFKSSHGFLTAAEYDALGLAANDWRPSVTDYYRFALARPELDGLLCALDDSAHVGALDAALAAGPLDEEETQYLVDLADLAAGRASLDTSG